MSSTQLELDSLVKEVLKKRDRIIPIIGDDCYVGRIDGKVMTLQKWIAQKILGTESSPEMIRKIYTEGYGGLYLLFEEYRRIYQQDLDFSDVVSCVDKGVEDKEVFLRRDVKDFILAGKFEVIVTTCPFHILKRELEGGVYNLNYNISSFAPISSKGVSRSEAKLKIPSIYQVFGDCDGECVFGEEDLLKFLHYLNQTDSEKGFGASELVKYIKEKGQDNKGLGLLMPIGCNNLPNWLFRFLWYPFSQEKLIGRDKMNQGGVWHKFSTDEYFYKFLRTYRFKTFSSSTDSLECNSGEDPVLNRLTQELKVKEQSIRTYASQSLNVQWNPRAEWDYFISYASEDESLVNAIFDELTVVHQKAVWKDNRGGIRPGDNYWSTIQYGIEHSNKYLFIISNDYLKKAIDKNHKYEGGIVEPTGVFEEVSRISQFLLDKMRDGQKGVCVPLIVKGCTVTYTDISGELHTDEELTCGLLEKLPKFKQYEMLRTEFLFEKIQGLVISSETIKEDLDIFFQ